MTMEQEAKLNNLIAKLWKIFKTLVGVAVILKVVQLVLIFVYLQGYYYGCIDIPKIIHELGVMDDNIHDQLEDKMGQVHDICKSRTEKQWDSR